MPTIPSKSKNKRPRHKRAVPDLAPELSNSQRATRARKAIPLWSKGSWTYKKTAAYTHISRDRLFKLKKAYIASGNDKSVINIKSAGRKPYMDAAEKQQVLKDILLRDKEDEAFTHREFQRYIGTRMFLRHSQSTAAAGLPKEWKKKWYVSQSYVKKFMKDNGDVLSSRYSNNVRRHRKAAWSPVF